MSTDESLSSRYRRRGLILANVIISGVMLGPWRRFSAAQRLGACAGWVICRAALIHGVMLPNSTILGPVIRDFRPTGREVWLTLDDGPHPQSTPALLDLLGEYEAVATFFTIGRRVAAHPALVRAVAEAGHEVGNHTHTHASGSFWAASPTRLRLEVRKASAAIEKAAGVVPRLFRAPAGISSPLLHGVLNREGLRRVGWNARGFDGVEGFTGRSVERMMRGIRPGTIILFHGEGRTAATGPARLKRLLQRLTAEGYRCVVPANL